MNKYITWICNGIMAMTKDLKKAAGLVGWLTLLLLAVTHSDKVYHIYNDNIPGLDQILKMEYKFGIIIGIAVSTFLILMMYGMPIQAIGKTKALERIGLKNRIGEVPYLLAYSKEGRVRTFDFASCGIPLEDWKNKQPDLEAVLNLTIESMTYISGTQRIRIRAVPALSDLPAMIRWNNWNIPAGDFILALGEGLTGKVTVNLAISNSILIGGSTGSGKSVLLRSLLYQASWKGADIVLADFKGAVDYTDVWTKMCKIVTDPDSLEMQLQQLIRTLEDRKKLFKTEQVRNIHEYNEKYPNKKINRVIFACDEVAELLDKTGADKSRKEQISRVEGYLSTVARQGRAFGIHLILSTQRPDANILSGQIKNNIDTRICGTADNVLSMIILDNTEAAEKIPSDIQGRFITKEGVLFQGYYLTDDDVARAFD